MQSEISMQAQLVQMLQILTKILIIEHVLKKKNKTLIQHLTKYLLN